MSLYSYFAKSETSFSASDGKFILGTGDTNPNTGHVDNGCFTRLGFQEIIHGSLKRLNEFPEIARRAQILRRLSGEYGWAGTHGHSLLEQSLYSIIDQAKSKNNGLSLFDCNTAMWRDVDYEWDLSLKFDAQTFLAAILARRSGDPFAVWLRGHAMQKLSGHPIVFEGGQKFIADSVRRERYKNWLKPSADYILHHLGEMIEGVPYDKWFMIEGKPLFDGEIVDDSGMSQEELRAKRFMPSFDLIVDGIKVRIFCTVDFAYLVEDGLRIADLKTGKAKESYSYQLGLYGFAVTQMFPGRFDPEQISFRLMYPAIEGDDKYVSEKFDSKKLEEVRQTTEEKIRKILGAFSELGSRDTTTRDALQSFVDTYPEKDAACIWALSKYSREGKWPKSMPQVRKAYPLELYKDYEPTYFKPEVPSKADVMQFMLQRFSPLELGRGFKVKMPEIVHKLEKIIEHRNAKGKDNTGLERVLDLELSRILTIDQRIGKIIDERNGREKVDNLWVNLALAQELCPSGSAEEFLNNFDPSHLRVILAHKTPANGVSDIPEHCPNCTFLNICDPGKQTMAG